MKVIPHLSRLFAVVIGCASIFGCSAEPDATTTPEEVRQRQINRATAMEQEVGR